MTTPFNIIERKENPYYKTCIVEVISVEITGENPMKNEKRLTNSAKLPVSMPLDTEDENAFIIDYLTNKIKLQGF